MDPTDNDNALVKQPVEADNSSLSARQRLFRFGAVAAVVSAALAVAANLSEVAGWFAPDETREIVAEAREVIVDTDSKVDELLILLRNQAAASGMDLNIESEVSIRNAVKAIVASGNASKRSALASLEEGDVSGAAEAMSRVANEQAIAVERTGDVAAETWREAGALFYTYDFDKAIHAFSEAARLQPGNADTLVRLGRVYVRAGRPDDARRVLEESLTLASDGAVRSGAYHALGTLARQLGDYDGSNTYLEQALGEARASDAGAAQVLALNGLGELERARGNPAAARSQLNRALALARDQGDRLLEAEILLNLGILAAESEDYDDAERLIGEAIAIHEAQNDRASLANSLGKLGAVAVLRDDRESAETLLTRTVELKEALRWDASVVYDLMNLGTLAASTRDFDAAGDYFGRAENLARRHGMLELAPVITYNRGEMALNQNDMTSACRLYGSAAPELEAMGSQYAAEARERFESNCN